MHAHEPSLATEDDRRSTLSRQERYKSGDGSSSYNLSTSHHSTETEWLSQHSHSTTSSRKLSHDSIATPGAYESSGPPGARYVYRPCHRPSMQPSSRFSTGRMAKEYDYPRVSSVGSFTHSVHHKDNRNEKLLYKENDKPQYEESYMSQYEESYKPQYEEGYKSQYKENYKSQSTPLVRNPTSMIEVSPGHEARLRGAAETWQAIQQDFYLPCVCFDCEASLFCILDAWLVLCPHCRVLNPICHDNGDMAMDQDGGVGLGFTIETLMEAQASLWRDF
jgi:hypothetical protein